MSRPLKLMEQRKDRALEERSQMAALIARMTIANGGTAGLGRVELPEWDETWRGCVYIELPNGVVSWNFADSHRWAFAGIPPYEGDAGGYETRSQRDRVNGAYCSTPNQDPKAGAPVEAR